MKVRSNLYNILCKAGNFVKKEAVLSASAILAATSVFFVPPDTAYAGYIDYRVIALLFCLMLVVAGLQQVGLFKALGSMLLKHAKNTRQLTFILVFLCFFCSMFITNDVSLITFAPFAVMILSASNQNRLLIPVIVLQTIAANLGSMLTPVGNPQNLYLYSAFHISISEFLSLMLPLTAISAILLIIAILILKNEPVTASPAALDNHISGHLRPVMYILLFFVCLMCVIHMIEYPLMLMITVIVIFFCDKSLFKNVDYFLLLTFACFFIFIGNMERIPAVSELINRLILNRETMSGIILSQVISNVPAAILLSGFTDNFKALLYGVNIGGLGTLIASLASIISYRGYSSSQCAKKGKYILVFSIYNLIFLICLSIASFIIL